MDNKKDNHQYNSHDTFPSAPQKEVDIIAFFGNNEPFVFLYKKTEKLATALYMVTNLFSESEPMKWTLRRKVGDILSFILTYKDISSSQMSDFIHHVRTKILEIVSLLEVSSRSGLVSHMNFSILKKEFTGLLERLDTDSRESEGGSHQPTFSHSFFDIPRTHSVSQASSHTYAPEPSRAPVSRPVIKDTYPVPDSNAFKRTNRQTIIISLIKRKKEVSIKDISEVIKDCSEKTLQRELLSLVAANILVKTGERRWSKYSLPENA